MLIKWKTIKPILVNHIFGSHDVDQLNKVKLSNGFCSNLNVQWIRGLFYTSQPCACVEKIGIFQKNFVVPTCLYIINNYFNSSCRFMSLYYSWCEWLHFTHFELIIMLFFLGASMESKNLLSIICILIHCCNCYGW